MAFQFHYDAVERFEQQHLNARQFVAPFIEKYFPLQPGMQVLEIGCGEGGVLKAFIEKGCMATGVDLDKMKIKAGKELMKEEIASGKINFFAQDIYEIDFEKQFKGKFDWIVLKDTIEHIHDQQKLISHLKIFLTQKGKIFFGFPPWYMPFGGHQQICETKLLALLPYYHLLPGFLYKSLLKIFEEPDTVEALMEIKETGISIERFERIAKKTRYRIAQKKFYLINPIYQYKFKLKPREQFSFISSLPYLRDFLTTCVYYVIEPCNTN